MHASGIKKSNYMFPDFHSESAHKYRISSNKRPGANVKYLTCDELDRRVLMTKKKNFSDKNALFCCVVLLNLQKFYMKT